MREILETHPLSLLLIPAVVAFCAVCWIHPRLVRLALRKNIVDNPDSRKLQRMPVPVLGGTAVFFGLCLGLGCLSPFFDCARLFPVFTLMALMLYTGTLDDIMGLSPRLRFAIEILAILLLVLVSHHAINDFHGLWGVHSIPMWAATLLTVFASVGIINAINLIDGVNGLSSGYCVLACSVFSIYFYMLGDLTMTVLGLVCIGALVPFFIHNVFGDTSRMFIGDGGTLVMGLVMSPDKTHLHHLFIDTGFSHPGTTFCILTLNTLVIAVWWMLYRLGASFELQLYAVVLLGLLSTFGLYVGVKRLPKKGRVYRFLRRLAVLSHVERKGLYFRIQRLVDKA